MHTLLLAALLAIGGARAAAQIPETFTNLQVLPKDISRRDLVAMMRGFCFHLDVRCEHCHVGEGDDLSKFDFASDARPAKAVARRMMTMMAGINAQVADVGAPAPSGTGKVTCYTCHRGSTRPLAAPPGGGGRLLAAHPPPR